MASDHCLGNRGHRNTVTHTMLTRSDIHVNRTWAYRALTEGEILVITTEVRFDSFEFIVPPFGAEKTPLASDEHERGFSI